MMTMKSHKVLKKAIDEAGVKRVASDLKVSGSLVYKWCKPPANQESLLDHGALNPLDRVAALYRSTSSPEIINWLCSQADGYYVANPPKTGVRVKKREFLQKTQQLVKEFSELLNTISASFEDDSRIDEKESEQIRKEWEDLKRMAEGFVRACESGCFG